MTTDRYQRWRRIVRIIEAVLILGIPFLRIKGESALRFDIPSLKLHFFGFSLWMDEFFVVLAGTMFLVFLFILITLLFGRIWCGWVCPQTVLNEMTSFIDKKKKGPANTFLSMLLVLILSVLVAANLIWYFVSPCAFLQDLFLWELGTITWGFWISLTAIMFLNFSFIRYAFCATVCPYAKLQGAFYDNKTLTIAMDPIRKNECIECLACVKSCPVNIDIRDGSNSACINCAKCVGACTEIMSNRNKTSLIDYFFGLSGGDMKIFRVNAVLIGMATLAFLVFTLFQFYHRASIDMTVLPNNAYHPRVNERGDIVNSFILSVKNRGKDDHDIIIRTDHDDKDIRVVPDTVISIKAGEAQKLPVYVTVKPEIHAQGKKGLSILVINRYTGKILIKKTATILDPEG
ncbi:MAG: 4Fe-4S binding protein [Nitrospiraceae bacterium]|nr:MAG: 4Fe-4S binding protein [Nitrospiraceae bacterium]